MDKEDWIINTPAHKRWWLPDRRHQVDSQIMGRRLYMRVLDARFQDRVRQTFTIEMDKADWEDLQIGFCELAKKKYKAELRFVGRR